MNGSKESDGNKDRRARFQARYDREPGSATRALRGRGRQGKRVAQSRDQVIGIGKFADGRNGDVRLRSSVAECAALRRGGRTCQGSATEPMQLGRSTSSRLRASRWRSRGESDAGIAALVRAVRGREREGMTVHAMTTAGRRGSGWSSRALRRCAEPRASEIVVLKDEGSARGAGAERRAAMREQGTS